MRLVDGEWNAETGDFRFLGMWYPDGENISRNLAERLRGEPFYRADRFAEAMGHVREWRGAVDCGAHVGAWSRELARRFKRVVAIELNAATARCLERNVEGMGVKVFNVALGAAAGNVGKSGTKGSIDCEVAAGAHGIEMWPLDFVVADLPHIDYIKVHVNGYELEVLKGMTKTLADHRPVLTVVLKSALARYGATAESVVAFLAASSYRMAGGQKPYRIFVPA